jgi:two-component system cell cycle sensor histidine kinase/response regulator CckA
VVDDEPAVLDFISRSLSARGYDIVNAADPFQALRIAATPPPVNLVLSDVVMPRMQGPELVQRIRESCPAARAILISGFAPSPDLPADIPFVRKPFRIDDLVVVIEGLLANSVKPRTRKTRAA